MGTDELGPAVSRWFIAIGLVLLGGVAAYSLARTWVA
jgi:hypothetical protein